MSECKLIISIHIPPLNYALLQAFWIPAYDTFVSQNLTITDVILDISLSFILMWSMLLILPFKYFLNASYFLHTFVQSSPRFHHTQPD